MNLADMTKLIRMAGSGEVQGFIAKFEAELAHITADRLALKQAFPQGFIHFNKRFDAMEARLNEIHEMLAALTGARQLSNLPVATVTITEQDHVGRPTEHQSAAGQFNGAEHDATTTRPATEA